MTYKPDYHVASLNYKLSPCEDISYKEPPPVEFETEDARLKLDQGSLLCEMKSHFATNAEARAVVDPVLRAWEVMADLSGYYGELRFEFVDANIIDRNPRPLGSLNHVHEAGVTMSVSASMDAILHVAKNRYPNPPTTFQLTPDVESLWLRYQRYLDGHEPLLGMAYFCFTLVKSIGGEVKNTAAKFNLDVQVLRKLSELTSTRGDISTARKMTATPMKELAAKETAWIQAAIKAIILRLGDTRTTASLPKIKMSDLPAL